MRKILCLLVCFLMVSMLPSNAAKEDTEYTSRDYTYILDNNNEVVITKYSGIDFSLKIPSSIDGHPVKSIGFRAFSDCESLSSITLPDGLTSIGVSAFDECKSLTSITLPEDLLSIGYCAFAYCENLTFIKLPEGLTFIGDNAFWGCKNLTSITIPNHLETIVGNPFAECDNLKEITVSPDHPFFAIVDGVLFNKVENLLIYYPKVNSAISYTVPAFVKSIGEYAFWDCDNLISITLPEGLTSIGGRAFSFCSNLVSMVIPKGITTIENNTFANCTKLTSIKLPEGLTSIGDNAFDDCSDLTFITFQEGLVSIGEYAFSGCFDLSTITLPKGIISISFRAFFFCSNLISVTLPEGLVSIGNEAFSYCRNLSSIRLPASLASIGIGAFDVTTVLIVQHNSYAESLAKKNGMVYQYSDSTELSQTASADEKQNINFTIRNGITFGMTRGEIVIAEGREPNPEDSDVEMFFYRDVIVSGFDSVVAYSLTSEGILNTITYFIEVEHSSENLYISDYDTIEDGLTSKYGKPSESGPVWIDDLYKSDKTRYGFAVSLGDLEYHSYRDFPTYIILHSLRGDNYKIFHTITYTSLVVEDKKTVDNGL